MNKLSSTVLNSHLLDVRDCWDAVPRLLKLHTIRELIEHKMEASDMASWTENQYQLQDAWGFERDSRMHKFWEIEDCTCPKLDNGDSYPSGYYFTSEDCKIHG